VSKWKTIRVKKDVYLELNRIKDEYSEIGKDVPIWKILEFMVFSKAKKFQPDAKPVATLEMEVEEKDEEGFEIGSANVPVLAPKSGLQRFRRKGEEARKEGSRRRHNLSLLEKLGRRD